MSKIPLRESLFFHAIADSFKPPPAFDQRVAIAKAKQDAENAAIEAAEAKRKRKGERNAK